MTAPRSPRASRREVLTLGLVSLAVTGCDAVTAPPEPGADPSSSRPRTGAETPADPDEELVARVRTELTGVSVLLTSALRARPGLAAELDPFVTLHARHLGVLDGDRPRGREPVRGDAASVRGVVRAREARVQRELAAAALVARSGPLAALLASMSAAVAQQLAVVDA